jgi:hypothetical protein
MTTARQYADSEGDFGEWRDHPRPCWRLVADPRLSCPACAGGTCNHHRRPCGATLQVRLWDSHDGTYTDYQYRCAVGHVWWIDGPDA